MQTQTLAHKKNKLSLRRNAFLAFLYDRGALSLQQARVVFYSLLKEEGTVESLCVTMGFLSERAVFEEKSVQENCAFLLRKAVDPKALKSCLMSVSVQKCLNFCVVPVGIQKNTLTLAVNDCANIQAQDYIRSCFPGLDLQVVLMMTSDIQGVLQTASSDHDGQDSIQEKLWNEINNTDGQTVYKAPQEFWEDFFFQCLSQGISDVHLALEEGVLKISKRRDGVLGSAMLLNRCFAQPLMSCLKAMASLEVSVTRQSQQGRFDLDFQGRTVSVRLATHPSFFGEKMTVRFLNDAHLTVQNLQLHLSVQERIEEILNDSYGFSLVVGPTGCGKTTTLHAFLKELQKKNKVIVSLEDPVEYILPGIVQTTVSLDPEKTSYQAGIASALRQDIDVLCVGEVRTKEPAHMLLRAAMTGHQTLASVHAFGAFSVLWRLVDLGLSVQDLRAHVSGIVGQRLVRLLCPACKQPARGKSTSQFFSATGCPNCFQTGYQGRCALVQVESRASIRSFFDKFQTEYSEKDQARDLDVSAFRQAAVQKMQEGLIDEAECLRVLGTHFFSPENNACVAA